MVNTPTKNKIKGKGTASSQPVISKSKKTNEIFNFDDAKQTVKSLSSLMKILHESQNYLSNENIELRLRIEKIETENLLLIKKNELNENQIKNLSNEVSELKFELNEIKQEKLEGHFNINGLPQLTKDETVEVVLKIANELDINLTPSDIEDVNYFNNKRNNKHDYVFELKNKKLKKEFINKRKSKLIYVNNNLEVFSVNSNSSTINDNRSRIFINDHLTKFNHNLLNHTKSLKNCQYKYVWYKFGKIFAKQNDNSEIINIRSYQAVDNLIERFENLAKT